MVALLYVVRLVPSNFARPPPRVLIRLLLDQSIKIDLTLSFSNPEVLVVYSSTTESQTNTLMPWPALVTHIRHKLSTAISVIAQVNKDLLDQIALISCLDNIPF